MMSGSAVFPGAVFPGAGFLLMVMIDDILASSLPSKVSVHARASIAGARQSSVTQPGGC
jgi:hypothetical protein